jgi:hypothetical protein
MDHSEEYSDGFFFALIVLRSMGHRMHENDIRAQLASIANGDLSLMPSPEEAIQSMEQESGKQIPDSVKVMFKRTWRGRAEVDGMNRASAEFMLRMMGGPPEE